MKILDMIVLDIMVKVDLKSFLKTYCIQAGFRYTCELRKVQVLEEKGSRGIRYYYHRYKLLKYSKKYGFQINPKAQIGRGLYLGHRGTVIVNGATKMGMNVNIMPGVTIGQENRGKREGVPTLGNKVWIGSNAIIVGKITIGNNVLIAPNAYVNFDVPDNSIVMGNPAVVKRSVNATDKYIQNACEESKNER